MAGSSQLSGCDLERSGSAITNVWSVTRNKTSNPKARSSFAGEVRHDGFGSGYSFLRAGWP
jgi:hypothetical protein